MANSTTKFLSNVLGTITEVFAVISSAGAGDAQKLVALNASGIIDPTSLNGTTTSAGAGDSAKVVQLDAAGRVALTMMPVGVAPDVASIVASEALAAGDLVNIYDNAGTANCRKADGSTTGKPAHGFTLASVSALATATIYFEGPNTAVTGLTPGTQFLSGTTAGKSVLAASVPTGAGKTNQCVGFATSATSMNFQSGPPITTA